MEWTEQHPHRKKLRGPDADMCGSQRMGIEEEDMVLTEFATPG